jgi:tetratricopeptide (TPR) repeat protein
VGGGVRDSVASHSACIRSSARDNGAIPHISRELAMSQRGSAVLCVVAAVFLPAAVLACYWDADTLQMERTRFPSALELITGKFLRHTPEFYYWRIDDRVRKLKSEPDNLAYYDDLAVAYEKTGQHDKAIETILNKDRKKPGIYETESNLGTFLMVTGRLEEGLKHIDAALRINPDAHFGREKYQKRLAEYMIIRRTDGKTTLPLYQWEDVTSFTFSAYLAGAGPNNPNRDPSLDNEEREAAVKGILGMMRFANHDSPVLLEVLGDLLRNGRYVRHPEHDAKQLAARAYLKASYAMNDEKAREAYRDKARMAITGQSKTRHGSDQLPLEELEESFKEELSRADAWFAEVRKNELTWIKEGKDPEKEFARLYYEEPRVEADAREELPISPEYLATQKRVKIGLGLLGFLLFLVLVVLPAKIFMMWRASRAARSGATLSAPQNSEKAALP